MGAGKVSNEQQAKQKKNKNKNSIVSRAQRLRSGNDSVFILISCFAYCYEQQF